MREKCNKKGYYTLEAAVILPILIIAVLTMGYFMKLISAVEVGMHCSVDSSRRIAAQASYIGALPSFKFLLERRIARESSDVTEVDIENFRYLYNNGFNDGLISFDIDIFVGIKLPIKMKEGIETRDRILCRGWIGKENQGPSMTFEEMERDGDGRNVWIFPRAGERFHGKTCTYVKNNPIMTVLSDGIMKRYKGCKSCKSGKLTKGSVVYCYPSYGSAFHRSNCKSIDKYFTSIGRERALKRGYTACMKCGGK